MNIAIILTSLLFGIARWFVPTQHVSLPGTYQAFAHIWIGMLLVPAWQRGGLCRWAFWLLCVVELAAFAWSRV